METAVLSEIVKTLTHRGQNPQIYFWRTSAGTEVDIVIETGNKLVPIEVKLSATPRPSMAASIKTFREDFGDKAMAGLCGSSGSCPAAPGVKRDGLAVQRIVTSP